MLLSGGSSSIGGGGPSSPLPTVVARNHWTDVVKHALVVSIVYFSSVGGIFYVGSLLYHGIDTYKDEISNGKIGQKGMTRFCSPECSCSLPISLQLSGINIPHGPPYRSYIYISVSIVTPFFSVIKLFTFTGHRLDDRVLYHQCRSWSME